MKPFTEIHSEQNEMVRLGYDMEVTKTRKIIDVLRTCTPRLPQLSRDEKLLFNFGKRRYYTTCNCVPHPVLLSPSCAEHVVTAGKCILIVQGT